MAGCLGGWGGWGSGDVGPGAFREVIEKITWDKPSHYFTLGIKHPLALTVNEDPDVRDPGAFSMRGHSVGGYGSGSPHKGIPPLPRGGFRIGGQTYPKNRTGKKGLPPPQLPTHPQKQNPLHSPI